MFPGFVNKFFQKAKVKPQGRVWILVQRSKCDSGPQGLPWEWPKRALREFFAFRSGTGTVGMQDWQCQKVTLVHKGMVTQRKHKVHNGPGLNILVTNATFGNGVQHLAKLHIEEVPMRHKERNNVFHKESNWLAHMHQGWQVHLATRADSGLQSPKSQGIRRGIRAKKVVNRFGFFYWCN